MPFVTHYSQHLFTAQADGQRNQLTFPQLPFRLSLGFFRVYGQMNKKLSGDFMPECDG